MGDFAYGQPHCTTDLIQTCYGQKEHNFYKWIYIGQVKEGTNDIPHGVGIKLYRYGNIIEEGYWKDGKQHGRARFISTEATYSGEFKEGCYDGQGTFYVDGNKYTGQWDGIKGEGEINYKDGTKYIGQWDEDWSDNNKLKRHGLGTYYSAGGQVLNKGKWKYNKYVGKE